MNEQPKDLVQKIEITQHLPKDRFDKAISNRLMDNLVTCFDYDPDKFGKTISYYYSQLRDREKVTQKDVAERMQSHQHVVSDFERGHTIPRFKTLHKLFKAIGYKIVISIYKE